MSGILMRAGLALSMMVGANIAVASSPDSGGLPPWKFHMTPQQVTSFTDYGPYKSFNNGDLETYAGVFNGRKENVQFFFKDGALARIGIYLYEGQDIHAAAATWGKAFEALQTKFGDVELPYMKLEAGSQPPVTVAVATAAGATVDAGGKSQMAPRRQPADMFVFASFQRAFVQGQAFYYVTIYYDPPHG